MSFEHEGLAFNLLDTPRHQDLSEACHVPIAVGSADHHAIAMIA
jgi:peptide subunit release factor RF-3